mmetsp:Transcript_97961/g.210098  ORF Transcript_97961/g.210098 Transcript_97961/m.210098 type:complete len:404 (+) Transcript_97961:373-1584(+)
MSLGLLTTFVANLVAYFFSEFPHAVGGAVLPVIPIIAAYFQSVGPENCATCMLALPIITLLCGILTYFIGLIGVADIVKACPFIIFGGFIAGTGAQLLEFSLNMMYPDFKAFAMLGPQGVPALLRMEAWVFCGPGVLVAFGVFLLPRIRPGDYTFLLPFSVIGLAAAFYVVLFASGTTVAEARAQGWLFDVEVPKRLDFYRVWTIEGSPVQTILSWDASSAIRWDLLCSVDFALTILQVFVMGLLTSAKNIYGLSEVTHSHVDIDREVRVAGIQGVCCGLAGAIPGNLVMSFSVTAHKLGGRSKTFALFLAINSLIIFFLGDFAVAFLPKMVPACVLFWLGIVLCVYWVWDGVGSVSATEHAIVLVMICVDLVLDAGPMILLGLVLTSEALRNKVWLHVSTRM